MTLPLHLQMEIDIHAQLHQKEIAEGFAKLRAKLPPDPAEGMARLQALLMNAYNPMAQQMMRPANPFLPSQWDLQNAYPHPPYEGLGALGALAQGLIRG